MALAAYEEAVRFYHMAIQALEHKVPSDEDPAQYVAASPG